MPSKSLVPIVPAPNLPATILLGDDLQKGYSFTSDRWEGDESYGNAVVVSLYWTSKGWVSKVFEGESESWIGGKKTKVSYFKVFLVHPDDKSLYAWWGPNKDEWSDEPKLDELTWFEFVQPAEKKK